jgi:hypothetical protein
MVLLCIFKILFKARYSCRNTSTRGHTLEETQHHWLEYDQPYMTLRATPKNHRLIFGVCRQDTNSNQSKQTRVLLTAISRTCVSESLPRVGQEFKLVTRGGKLEL